MRALRPLILAALATSCASVYQETPEVAPDPNRDTVPIVTPGTQDYVNPGLSQLQVRYSRVGFSDSLWEPVEDQNGFGIEYSREPASLDFGWEVGYLNFQEDERDTAGLVESNISEFYAGARRTFGHSQAVWRPHFGGGMSVIDAEIRNQVGQTDSDWSLGVYVHAGLSAFVSRHLSVGVDIRTFFLSQLRLNGETLDANYVQLAVTAGWVL